MAVQRALVTTHTLSRTSIAYFDPRTVALSLALPNTRAARSQTCHKHTAHRPPTTTMLLQARRCSLLLALLSTSALFLSPVAAQALLGAEHRG